MQPHIPSAEAAHLATESLRVHFGLNSPSDHPTIGLILGTGWGQTLALEGTRQVPMNQIPGFAKLQTLEGHDRVVILGTLGNRRVIALRGRVHLNEAPYDPNVAAMVRLQVEMLLQLGVKTLILTAAAGSLDPDLKHGSLAVVDGFVTLYAPPRPLFAGEFVCGEDALDPTLRDVAYRITEEVTGQAIQGGYAMVLGPDFEGRRYDKAALSTTGAKMVGMSMLPEACIANLYKVPVVGLVFVSNSAEEVHSHTDNQQRAQNHAAQMGEVLSLLIQQIP